MLDRESERIRQKNRMIFISFICIFFYLFSFSSNNFFSGLGKLGNISLVIFTFLSLYTIKRFERYELWLMGCCACSVVVRALHVFDSSTFYAFVGIVQYVVSFGLLLIFSRLNIERRFIKFFHIAFAFFNILGFIDYFLSSDKVTFLIFGSMNTFAAVFVFLFLISTLLCFKRFKLYYALNMVLSAALIIMSHSRTPLMMVAIIFVGYFFLCLFKSKKVNRALFFVFVIAMILLIYIYIHIAEMFFYDWLNNLSNKIFGKNIDSGRPGIWKNLIDSVGDSWLFGKGQAMKGYDYSAHNQFIQIYGDLGIVGLFSMIITFGIIWYRYSLYCNDKIVRFCQICMIGFIVYNCFEVSLIQNKFALGTLQWFILAVGLNRIQELQKLGRENLNKINNVGIVRCK